MTYLRIIRREETVVTQPQNLEPITQEDVVAFAQKLESWGRELPPKERTLLQLLIARAEGTNIADLDVQGYVLPTLSTTTIGLFSPLLSTGRLSSPAWIQSGDLWAQWSAQQGLF